jgi:glycosyl hydrolase family 43
MLTRRRFIHKGTAALTLASAPALLSAADVRARYRNPILGGDHPDASPIRVGEDFYLTHSSFDYAPGLLIWHSRDLVNWKCIAAALRLYHGNVYAPYLCEYRGRFYIYFPADGQLCVVHADTPTGPAAVLHQHPVSGPLVRGGCERTIGGRNLARMRVGRLQVEDSASLRKGSRARHAVLQPRCDSYKAHHHSEGKRCRIPQQSHFPVAHDVKMAQSPNHSAREHDFEGRLE